MKYSVIIPAYNASATIARAVQSCLEQTLPPYEIIVIDDASKDHTASIVQSFENNIVRLLQLGKNRGVSYARNYGWDHAQGDYIAFLDSDDEWDKSKMEVCAVYMGTDKVLWHDFYYPEEIGNCAERNANVKLQYTSFASFLMSNPVATCTLVVPNVFQERYDNTMRYCEDHDLLLRLSFTKDVFRIPLPLAVVHRKINSPGGLSGSLWKMRKGELKMYTKLMYLHPLFIFIIPFLWLLSLAKHMRLLLLNKRYPISKRG